MELKTVHEAMQTAATRSAADLPLKTYSIRLDQKKAEMIQELCERHGTNMSEFLRACVDLTLADYKGNPSE